MDDFDKKINNINNNVFSNKSLNQLFDRYELWRKVEFSDAFKFDPDNYIFFTHSVTLRTKPLDYGLEKGGLAYSPSSDSFDIAFNPGDLRKKKRVSVALSTSIDNYTYGRIGYVVTAPVENILCVGQASFDVSNDELRKKILLSPEEALKDIFHEVVLEGSTFYGSVRPIAIFINLTNATSLEIEQTMFQLEQMKKATGDVFPIIDLSSKNYQLNLNSGKAL